MKLNVHFKLNVRYYSDAKSCSLWGWLSGGEVESPLRLWRRGSTLPGALGAAVHLGYPPRLELGVLNHPPGFSGLLG